MTELIGIRVTSIARSCIQLCRVFSCISILIKRFDDNNVEMNVIVIVLRLIVSYILQQHIYAQTAFPAHLGLARVPRQ